MCRLSHHICVLHQNIIGQLRVCCYFLKVGECSTFSYFVCQFLDFSFRWESNLIFWGKGITLLLVDVLCFQLCICLFSFMVVFYFAAVFSVLRLCLLYVSLLQRRLALPSHHSKHTLDHQCHYASLPQLITISLYLFVKVLFRLSCFKVKASRRLGWSRVTLILLYNSHFKMLFSFSRMKKMNKIKISGIAF